MDNISILTKLYDLRSNLSDKKDIDLVQHLIYKYDTFNEKELDNCNKKDFAMNAKFIRKYISENIAIESENDFYYNVKMYDIVNEFYKTQIYKDLVIQRFNINRNSNCKLKRTYIETMNIHTIETINKYFKL
jgi:hypothetical protein